MPRPNRKPASRNGTNGRRAEPPLSTRASDPPEFVERVQAEARRRLGGTIEEITRDPDMREITYNALATSLRETPPPVDPEWAAFIARAAEVGLIIRPGSGDPDELPEPMVVPGVSLSEAILEERYGRN